MAPLTSKRWILLAAGLTYVVDHFKGWTHNGHVTLQRGERSRLADYAAEVL